MKALIKKIKEIFSIPELKDRILFTILLILVYRVGSFIILPGVDYQRLANASTGGGITDIINIFAGGAFSRASIFALGIMPYISASIIMQLVGIAIPSVQKLQQEGESGRKKINQWTRYLTIAICALQAPSYLGLYVQSANAVTVGDGLLSLWWISSVIILISGTIFVMWLGEKITDRGIGNGISLLITIGIIAGLPGAFVQEIVQRVTGNGGLVILLVEIVFLLAVTILSILLVQGTRRIPIEYAKRVVQAKGGRQMVAGGKRQSIPLKVNASGVMPIIFAQAIMLIPSQFFGWGTNIQGVGYNLTFAILIIVFTYFYTAITVNPRQIAEELRRNQGFIPGVKPGQPTEKFIDNVLSRITLPGSVFLALVAILPAFAMNAGISQQFALFYGGTSLLIMVGVMLDTLQQIESYLLSRQYDGLMKTGRIKGRTSGSEISMRKA